MTDAERDDVRHALTVERDEARRERDAARRGNAIDTQVIRDQAAGYQKELAVLVAERDALALALQGAVEIVKAQPYYPDTHTGMRQQWVKDEIARKLSEALTAPGAARVLREVEALRALVPVLSDARTTIRMCYGRAVIAVEERDRCVTRIDEALAAVEQARHGD